MTGFKEIDSPVMMRLYTLTKHQFMFVFAAALIVFVISLIIGFLGPTAIATRTITARKLDIPPKKFKTGPFILNSGGLSRFNQHMWLFCQYQLTGLPPDKGYTLDKTFHISVKLLGSAKDTSYKTITHHYQNRTRRLLCDTESCDPILLLHIGWLAYPSYLMNLTVYDLNLPAGVGIRNVLFTFKLYEDLFTQMQIWFRFVFLVLSFTVTCMFTHSLRKFPVSEWCIEQRWMSILLPILLLYNNPLFPLMFLIQSCVPGLIDAIFQSSFFCALMLFWLCALHGIRQAERKALFFYLPKLLLVGIMWAIGCTIMSLQIINEMKDPSYLYKVDIHNFVILKIFFFCIAGLYVIYVAVLLFKSWKELRNLPYFDVRLKFLTVLMVAVVLISLIAVIIRFKSASILPGSPMAVSSNFGNTAEFLVFFTLFNLYLYIMAFMYSPSSRAIRDAAMKSLPSSFSMVGESDDDIIFDRRHSNNREDKDKE